VAKNIIISIKIMKKLINYDPKSDAVYMGIKKGIEEEFVEVSPGLNVELNSKGQVIGIEILNASKALKSIIKPLQRQILEPVK
jgi:uncharacterized protein YuzE